MDIEKWDKIRESKGAQYVVTEVEETNVKRD
jgi:hypothetical protein